jgi:hypothetical protein
VRELVDSIASNGYIDIEPLIVLLEGERYTVLEGNRRLAALRLLRDPVLAGECGFPLPPVAPELRQTFDIVSVYRVPDRLAARAFIGFKHINGPHAWDSLAKGRFAADWYARERGAGVTLAEIARKLGDNHATVKRLVQGIYVLDQAQQANVFSTEDRYPGRPFAFSHLYTALTRPGYRKFLRLPVDWRSEDPVPEPVPPEALENLGKVLTWLYGAEDTIPLIKSQNPDIKRIGEVLENPLARQKLESTGNLNSAHADVVDETKQFEDALLKSYRYAEEAQSKLSAIESEDKTLTEVARRLRKAAAFIAQVLEMQSGQRSLGIDGDQSGD